MELLQYFLKKSNITNKPIVTKNKKIIKNVTDVLKS